jgi:hypothetical protein
MINEQWRKWFSVTCARQKMRRIIPWSHQSFSITRRRLQQGFSNGPRVDIFPKKPLVGYGNIPEIIGVGTRSHGNIIIQFYSCQVPRKYLLSTFFGSQYPRPTAWCTVFLSHRKGTLSSSLAPFFHQLKRNQCSESGSFGRNGLKSILKQGLPCDARCSKLLFLVRFKTP